MARASGVGRPDSGWHAPLPGRPRTRGRPSRCRGAAPWPCGSRPGKTSRSTETRSPALPLPPGDQPGVVAPAPAWWITAIRSYSEKNRSHSSTGRHIGWAVGLAPEPVAGVGALEPHPLGHGELTVGPVRRQAGRPTPSPPSCTCTCTPTSPSSTEAAASTSWWLGPPSWASPPWPSPITTASTGPSASPRPARRGIKPIFGAEVWVESLRPCPRPADPARPRTRPAAPRPAARRTGGRRRPRGRTLRPGAAADPHHLVLLAETREGYANLCRLVSAAHLAVPERDRPPTRHRRLAARTRRRAHLPHRLPPAGKWGAWSTPVATSRPARAPTAARHLRRRAPLRRAAILRVRPHQEAPPPVQDGAWSSRRRPAGPAGARVPTARPRRDAGPRPERRPAAGSAPDRNRVAMQVSCTSGVSHPAAPQAPPRSPRGPPPASQSRRLRCRLPPRRPALAPLLPHLLSASAAAGARLRPPHRPHHQRPLRPARDRRPST